MGVLGFRRCGRLADSLKCGFVAAKAVVEKTGNPANRRDADACEIMNLPVRHVLLKQGHNLPAIHQRLQLSGCAQIFQKVSALVTRLQRRNRGEQGIFVLSTLTSGIVSVWLHGDWLITSECINALVH